MKQSVEGIETSIPEGMWEGIASGIAAGRRRHKIIAAATSAVAAAAIVALAIVLPDHSGNNEQAAVLARTEEIQFPPENSVRAERQDNSTSTMTDTTDVAEQVVPQTLPAHREPAFERPKPKPVKSPDN